MKLITAFDPSLATTGEFDPLTSNPCGRIVLFNATPYSLTLKFQNGDVRHLPSYYYRSFSVKKPGTVAWEVVSSIAVASSVNNLVRGESYESSEAHDHIFSEGAYGMQTVVANSIPVSTNVDQIVNDGNPSENVVEATLSGSSGSNLLLKNDGTVTVAEYVAAVLKNLLQIIPGASTAVKLGNTSRATEILGNLIADGTLALTGALTASSTITATGDISTSGDLNFSGGQIRASGTTIIDASGFDAFFWPRGGSGNVVHIGVSGTDWGTFSSSGIGAPNGVNFNIGRIKDFNTFSGTGTGTFNHGLSGSPVDCWPTTNVSGSTQTMGCSTFTSTTVRIDTFSGLAWRATAYR